MPNYYDILKISQSATTAEIQIAYDSAYNYWRGLVNHHEPQMAQRANQALLAIEQIRTTLLDSAKRADYDVSLSLGTIGGLADASASPSSTPMMTPPMVRPTSVPARMGSSPAINTEPWACPKCRSANAIGTRFCKQCGTQLGKDCPKCNGLLEITAQFCSNCGVNIDEYQRELEIKTAEAERQRAIEQHRIAENNARMAVIIKSSTDAMNYTKYGWIISIVGSCIPYLNFLTGFVGLIFFGVAVASGIKALQLPQQHGDQDYRSKARTALWLSGLPLGLSALAFVIVIFAAVASAFQ